jgi:hypothetical protein
VRGELAAQLPEASRKPSEQTDLLAFEWKVTLEEVLVARRQGRNTQVGDLVCEMLVHVRGLTALELGIPRQCLEPRRHRVAERADRRARVGQEKPRALLVMAEHLADPVGPPLEEPRGKPRLECLHRSARLEPGNAAVERHAQHRRPRFFVLGLDGAHRFDVLPDPDGGGGAVLHVHRGRPAQPTGSRPEGPATSWPS